MMRWKNKLKSRSGASLAIALLLFLICSIGVTMLLAAAMEFVPKRERWPVMEMAASFLSEEIADEKNMVKIVEIPGKHAGHGSIRYYYVGVDGDPDEKETWQRFETGSESGILDSLIREAYVSQKTPEEFDQTKEKKLQISLGTAEETGEPAVAAELWIEADYTIHAILSDIAEAADGYQEKELRIPAEVWVETASNGEKRKADDEVQITTIQWRPEEDAE